MGLIAAFFGKLDAFIQKRFDSVCFFLMRRFGVRKSSIRYALNSLIIGAYVGDLGGRMRYGLASPAHVILGGIFVLIMLLGQHFEAKQDREAESRPGVASKSDQYPSGISKAIAGFFLALECLAFGSVPEDFVKANLVDGQHYFPAVCSILFWIAFLSYLYLRKTPMNPPAEKVRESILAPQPAPAKL